MRFSVVSDDAAVVRICWVRERDHHPFAHGSLSYSLAGGCFLPATEGAPPPELVGRQAEAYVKSYLRRQTEASDS